MVLFEMAFNTYKLSDILKSLSFFEVHMLLVEIVILCFLFFILCLAGTGTDDKNLKNYESYPDEVQKRIREIPEYAIKIKEKSKWTTFVANLVVFLVLFFICGIFIREKYFCHNFVSILILGQVLNVFDLLVIDLFWWRKTKRIRFSKIPQKKFYQNPRKHIESFFRALVMYFLVAVIDGYLLTLF
ncbi:hypothetical protein HMPREF3189_01197 [Clostridiales bacterium KA00134]|nr:hypothetical protein HMPREF3189_01197 [Clostridiales bacterium KA00134]